MKVTRERTVLATTKSSTVLAYYIASHTALDVASAAHRIRRHWSIENELHWVLDMAFREDEARHRARNTAPNMTTLRHFALNLLTRFPERRLGVAASRKRAGWDRDFLLLQQARNVVEYLVHAQKAALRGDRAAALLPSVTATKRALAPVA
mgnify:CR=1 FL=1